MLAPASTHAGTKADPPDRAPATDLATPNLIMRQTPEFPAPRRATSASRRRNRIIPSEPPAIFLLLLLSLPLLLAGCVGPHEVRIEAAVNNPPPGAPTPQAFWIRNGQPGTDIEGLRYKEAIARIKTALSGRGLYEAPNESSADMVIEIDYGVTSQRQRFNVKDEPATRKGKRNKNAPAVKEPAESAPARGSGVSEIDMDTNVYEKHLVIEARAANRAASDNAPEFLWRVKATSTDQDDDLRKYVTLLAAASIDYIGRETDGEKRITVDENGVDVTFVKKGM